MHVSQLLLLPLLVLLLKLLNKLCYLLQPLGIKLANFPFSRVRLLLNTPHLALMKKIQAVYFGLQNLPHLLLELGRFRREKLCHFL